jgi:hypothetical protein
MSSGGKSLLGEVSGTYGPGLVSTLIAGAAFAALASGLGAALGARVDATPRLLRWTERRTRTLANLRFLVADTVTLVRSERTRPGAPVFRAAPASADTGVVRPAARAGSHVDAASGSAPAGQDAAAAPATAAAGPDAGAAPAPADAGSDAGAAPAPVATGPAPGAAPARAATGPDAGAAPAAGAPAPRPFRWRRPHAYALVAVLAAGALGVAGYAFVQQRQQRAAVEDAARAELPERPSMFAERLGLDVEAVRARDVDEMDVGDITDRSATVTARVLLEVTPGLPRRYRPRIAPTLLLDGTWTVRLEGDKGRRAWTLASVRPAGALRRSPELRAEPDEATIADAREVATQAVTAALTVHADETPDAYNTRQPDVYLTDLVTDEEAIRELVARDEEEGAVLERHAPFVYLDDVESWFGDTISTWRGTAFEAVRELIYDATEWCIGDQTLREATPTVGDWTTESVEQDPLGGLQHVALTASVTIDGASECNSDSEEDETGEEDGAGRSEASADTTVSVWMARPQIVDLDGDWRVERIELGTTTVYEPYPDRDYDIDEASDGG